MGMQSQELEFTSLASDPEMPEEQDSDMSVRSFGNDALIADEVSPATWPVTIVALTSVHVSKKAVSSIYISFCEVAALPGGGTWQYLHDML